MIMKKRVTVTVAFLQIALLISPALAGDRNDKSPKDDNDDHEAPSLDDEPVVTKEQLVEQEIAELRDRLKESEEAQRSTRSPLTVRGYADLGFFVPRGNGGAGWVRDAGHSQFPQYSGYAWTFLGDILATTINSRGEVADLG